MRITFLTPNLEMHGGNLVMLKYADYLCEKGHDVTIISSDLKTLEVNPKIKIKLFKHFPIKYIDFFFLQSLYYKKIELLIDECDFVIPIYTPLLIPAIHAKNKNPKIKVLLFFQDSFEMVWVGKFIRSILGSAKYGEKIDGAVCVSENNKKALKGLLRSNLQVITNGIESDVFFDRNLVRKNYVLFVGRPQLPKGYPYFKEAMRELMGKYPNIEGYVVSPINYRGKKNKGIRHIKYKDRVQLSTLYSQAKIYVSASLSESFGLPPLEAMASGTPVVMTNTVGSREYAINGENCLIVPIKKSHLLYLAMERILANESLCAKLKKGGIMTASRYNWKLSLEKFEQYLYEAKGLSDAN